MLGAGPAHLQVMRAFAAERPVGLDLLLLAPGPEALLPACLAAAVAGRLGASEALVPLAPLAEAAGAVLATGGVARWDLAARVVHLADGRRAEYELLSLDAPPEAPRDALPGAREHALFSRPAEGLLKLLPAVDSLAQQRVLDVVVVGDGRAEAFELALALEERFNGAGPERARIALVAGPAGPLADYPAKARAAALQALAARRITVFREAATAVRAGAVVLASGARLACDVPVVAGSLQPAPALLASGLTRDAAGAWQAGPTLQSPAHPEVFVAGDGQPRDAALLALNLRRQAAGGTLQHGRAASRRVQWLAAGGRRAIAVWGSWVSAGRWAGWCKRRAEQAALAAIRAA